MNDFTTITFAKHLASQLREAFHDAEDALADTIEGEVNLTDALYRVLLSAEKNRYFASAIKGRIDELKARMDRIVAAEGKKRAIVQAAMEQCGMKKIERPEFTVSLVPSPSKVIITDETALPPECVRTKIEPDKDYIKAQLKNGYAVPGAELSNGGYHLTLRRS